MVRILNGMNTDTPYVCVPGGKKWSFGKFDVLCFLETPVLRLALLPYYQLFLYPLTFY